MQSQAPTCVRNSLVSPAWDFWLLGGFSCVLGAVFLIAEHYRFESTAVKGYLLRIPATFGVLSLICNYPHFLISYKIGYGRGTRFIGRNWFQLILVPIALLTLFLFSFQLLDYSTPENQLTRFLNSILGKLGTEFTFGTRVSLGHELLMVGVWFMYLTVGWHYSKQVFGCIATYSAYESYPLSLFQRQLVKANLLSLALFNFVFINTYARQSGYSPSTGAMATVLFEFPVAVAWICGLLLAGTLVAVLLLVVGKNFRSGKKPGPTTAIIFVAFYVWWLPLFQQPEFYLWAVPFFHSMQYLPFAYRMEKSGSVNHLVRRASLRLIFLFFAGLISFELFPEFLDSFLDTPGRGLASFFAAAAVVFLNVHHFFIDNVSWRFKDSEVRAALLG